jgi:hypothetical protein
MEKGLGVGGWLGAARKPTNFTVMAIIDRLCSRCYKHLLCAECVFVVAKVYMAAQGVPTRPNQHSLSF